MQELERRILWKRSSSVNKRAWISSRKCSISLAVRPHGNLGDDSREVAGDGDRPYKWRYLG